MIIGQDRNEDKLVAHIYDGDFNDPGKPLCARGWNRGGTGYSIFRNYNSGEVCRVCLHRQAKGLKGVPSRAKKTKWL